MLLLVYCMRLPLKHTLLCECVCISHSYVAIPTVLVLNIKAISRGMLLLSSSRTAGRVRSESRGRNPSHKIESGKIGMSPQSRDSPS